MSYSFLIKSNADTTVSIPVGNYDTQTATLYSKSSTLTSSSITGGKANFTITAARVNDFTGYYVISIGNTIVQAGNIDIIESENGIITPGRLGTGVTSASTILYGDGTWKVAPTSTSGTITSADITDATTIGKSILTAADAPTVRTNIGAGTSNLAIGTASTNAKAGNYQPAWSDITSKPTAFAPGAHTHVSTDISDSTTTGRNVLTAIDQPGARTAIGAGTSNLAIGTTSTTAKAGNYAPASTDITDATVVGKSLITSTDGNAARATIGAGTSNLTLGTTSSTAKTGDYTPAWTDVTSKPTTFAPSAHTHTIGDISSTGGSSGQVLTVQSDGTLAWSTSAARQVIEHGSVAATIRPVTSGPVTWIGTVQPSNWLDGDDWYQATAVATDIPTANLVNYWRAEDLGLTSGQAVTTMANRVSGGPALTASGGPVFDIESSTSSILLDGVDDQLSETTTSLTQPTTVISVGRFVATAASKPWVSAASTVQAITVTSSSKWSANAATSLPHTASIDTGWHLVAAVFNNTSTIIYVDGVAVTGAGGTNTRTGNRIGANSGATAFSNMKIVMVAEYSTALATTDLDAIRAALKNRYAVLP